MYMVSNLHRTVLYIGSSRVWKQRVHDHKRGEGSTFTKKYRCYYLLRIEEFDTYYEAFVRERQVKKWNREWKWNLIKTDNPELKDLWPGIMDLRNK